MAKRGGAAIAVLVFLVFALPFLFWFGARIVKGVLFDIRCTGHLKRAADANTVKLAEREMNTAVTYLRERGIIEGYTSILYRTPDEDVGFWYSNLSQSLVELQKIDENATQLEKSNVLMKLRETLLDSGSEGGVIITCPDGISVFPHNVAYCLWGIFSAIIAIVGALWGVWLLDN